jgi:hypothetical protein
VGECHVQTTSPARGYAAIGLPNSRGCYGHRAAGESPRASNPSFVTQGQGCLADRGKALLPPGPCGAIQ